ncbi:MAG: hypothetical protein Q4P32_10135 [Micrococcales bacterium]|nr:hypothetical protein [Micrococcales bacterium]
MAGWGSTTSDLMLRLAHDARARRFVESRTIRHDVVRRYVAGESLSGALDATGELLVRGRRVSVTHLALDPLDRNEARERRKRLSKLVRRLDQAGYTSAGRVEISLRLGTLGAHLGRDGLSAATQRAASVVEAAAAVGAGVTLETEPTLDQGRVIEAAASLRALPGAQVALALPSGMPRTESDCVELAADGWRIRLYQGPVGAAGAYARRAEANRAYVRCLQTLMAAPPVPIVATQDTRLLAIAEELAARTERADCGVEYLLPYGMRPERQAVVADRGGRMQVYVPYGPDWYPYLMSRLAEQPGDVAALLRAAAAR